MPRVPASAERELPPPEALELAQAGLGERFAGFAGLGMRVASSLALHVPTSA